MRGLPHIADNFVLLDCWKHVPAIASRPTAVMFNFF